MAATPDNRPIYPITAATAATHYQRSS